MIQTERKTFKTYTCDNCGSHVLRELSAIEDENEVYEGDKLPSGWLGGHITPRQGYVSELIPTHHFCKKECRSEFLAQFLQDISERFYL